ncbi:MAG: hypothetical protein K8U03_23735 [Planctomycetia bacterium]|nr:hypothetical protein [Planctomycetia bacterium]
MAKKRNVKPNTEAGGESKVNKSAAIREYLKGHKQAKPKEVVAALREYGFDVSPNMVSMIRAQSKVKRAVRHAAEAKASHSSNAGAKLTQADGLDAALTLYKAAQGQQTPTAKLKAAFLKLVEVMG